MFRRLTAVLFLFLLQGAVFAADNPAAGMTAEQFSASLHYRQGEVKLPGGLASLAIPDGFRYLDPDDTERVLVDAWGNPPGHKTLGMILPAHTNPAGASAWGVVITYVEDGHVSDKDADAINYTDLLHKMQARVHDANADRKKQGYDTVDLVGWAEPPRYDAASHKLYWAKELRFGNGGSETLNYCVRILGRKGVLELNAVSAMDQLPTVRKEMRKVIAFTNFSQGSRYSDFDPSADKVAEYGIATLVAGAVAAKAGLFAKLFALLLAAKKLVIAAIVGLGAMLRGLFGGKKKSTT